MVTTESASGTTTKTYTYIYDAAGNILSEKKNGTTVNTYTYGDTGWKDLLTEFNGTAIDYDKSGNPTNFYNGAKTYTDLTWENGRQLKSLKVGSTDVSYGYDGSGIRTTKVADGFTYEYVTQSGRLVYETATGATAAYVMYFAYDESGRPFSIKFSKDGGASFSTYYYVLNLQGDVVKIVAQGGTVVGSYEYDAWGRITSMVNADGRELADLTANTASTAIAYWNPLTYRGYFDTYLFFLFQIILHNLYFTIERGQSLGCPRSII